MLSLCFIREKREETEKLKSYKDAGGGGGPPAGTNPNTVKGLRFLKKKLEK